MSGHAHGFGFDQHGAFAPARLFDRFARRAPDSHDVIAIHYVAGDPVSTGSVGKVAQGSLPADRSGVSPLIILDNQDEWRALHGGQVHAFVKRTRGRAAVADPGHGHDFLAQVAAAHGHSGHHRDQIAQHGDGRNDMPALQIAEVARAVLALGGRGNPRHILGENVARLVAADQKRAHVADHRRDPIALGQGVGRAYGRGFLPQASVQATDDFILPE